MAASDAVMRRPGDREPPGGTVRVILRAERVRTAPREEVRRSAVGTSRSSPLQWRACRSRVIGGPHLSAAGRARVQVARRQFGKREDARFCFATRLGGRQATPCNPCATSATGVAGCGAPPSRACVDLDPVFHLSFPSSKPHGTPAVRRVSYESARKGRRRLTVSKRFLAT